jgi:DnaA family protein
MTVMKQIPLAIGPAPLPSFEGFVPGANAAALQHLQALPDQRGPTAPVYLWGAPGSGKTHLLHALAHQLQRGGQRVGWFDASDPLPWTLQPDWALVVIDHCDGLAPAAQQAAFALFVEAGTHGVQIAAGGRLPPVDLPLRDDLRTRLAWGHVFALQPLSEAETRSALRREADRRGIFLSDEVMDYLLTRFSRDLKTLMQWLDRLDEFSLARARPVTVPLLRLMLAEEASESAGCTP